MLDLNSKQVENTPIPDEQLIRIQSVVLHKQGFFSTVFWGMVGFQMVVIKELHKIDSLDPREMLKREVEILEKLKNPRVVKFYGASIQPYRPFIVMEYIPGYTLEEWLTRNPKVSWIQLSNISLDVLEGVEYIHQVNIVHGDLRPPNIILDPHQGARLIDFGLAKLLGDHEETLINVNPHYSGACRWLAPEILTGNKSSQASDIYAFGLLVWQIVTIETYPYPDQANNQSVIASILKGELNYIPPTTPLKLEEIITECWGFTPNQRPSTQSLIKKFNELPKILSDGISSETSAKFSSTVPEKRTSQAVLNKNKKERTYVNSMDRMPVTPSSFFQKDGARRLSGGTSKELTLEPEHAAMTQKK